MGDGTSDKLKGDLKELGGDATGDKSLKNEGKVDKASGNAKDALGKAADKAKDLLNRDKH
ncbi:MAG: CsbD family protein [Solirubrobacterales bacterium]|nr:CsbD family protein [Solirubrobacterales bacterium]